MIRIDDHWAGGRNNPLLVGSEDLGELMKGQSECAGGSVAGGLKWCVHPTLTSPNLTWLPFQLSSISLHAFQDVVEAAHTLGEGSGAWAPRLPYVRSASYGRQPK